MIIIQVLMIVTEFIFNSFLMTLEAHLNIINYNMDKYNYMMIVSPDSKSTNKTNKKITHNKYQMIRIITLII